MTLSRIFTKMALLPLLALLPLAGAKASAANVYPLVIHTADGAQMFDIEMVQTPEDMAEGLMNRKSMAADHGMIFLFGPEQLTSFWMKNTLIPLDMLFIKANGQIATIHPMAKPLDEAPISSGVPVAAVLEINGGESEKRGIKVGDMVETSFIKDAK